MAQTNAINNKTDELTVDPGASGDSFIQFDINATGEFRVGVDDTATDAFKISQGSALGTTDTVIITAAGEVTKPLNPAFLGQLPSTSNNITGDGTSAVFGSTTALTEVFDQGGDFVTGGTFTAPVTGNYVLMLNIDFESEATGGTTSSLKIVTSNRTYESAFFPTRTGLTGFFASNNAIGSSYCVLADMDSSDTATVQILSSGGAKVDDIVGSGTLVFSCFSGMLVS